jgi:HD-like signal output (HDOD) protein
MTKAADIHAPARRRLPPLSTMAQRIVQQVTREDADLAALARLIELDPGLTVAVLKLVNSPFYGLQRQVGTVSEAIMVLGMATVRRVAIASAIAGPLQALGLRRELLDTMWRHAISSAVLASRLLDGHAASQLAFTAGVLQDLGRLALHLDGPAAYAPLEALGGADLCAAERAACGQTHAAVGAALAESWALPAPIVEAIALHHRPAEQAGAGAAAQAVCLASLIVDGDAANTDLPPLCHVQVDPALALAASRRETDALCALVGA